MASFRLKLAEKLIILNDRGTGLLTRIYNVKKMLQSNQKPRYFREKEWDGLYRTILKKFPNLSGADLKSFNSAQANQLREFHNEISQDLKLYYETFVDILEFKDHVEQILSTVDQNNIYLSITDCFDLTAHYLDLIVVYVSIMIIISRIDDRKVMLGLYNIAHDLYYDRQEENYPRLGQLVIDYSDPLRKFLEEFTVHASVLTQALESLFDVYRTRNRAATEWRRAPQLLSLLTDSSRIQHVTAPEIPKCLPCEYLSFDRIEKWIIFGFMVTPQQLQHKSGTPLELWKMANRGSFITQIFREEVLHTQIYIQSFFETIKGYTRRVSEMKEWYAYAVQSAPPLHRDRRNFLRAAMKEMILVFTDQPGLLGPKCMDLLKAISLARDEVTWYLRHFDNLPEKRKSHGVKIHHWSRDEFMDRMLPELLFYIEELRSLIRRYTPVIQRYYVQFLFQTDSVYLEQAIQSLNVCAEEELSILSDTHKKLSPENLNLDVLDAVTKEGRLLDFRDVRIDWCRLQAYTCVKKAHLPLIESHGLAEIMNTISVHTRLVDNLDEILDEISDLSIWCFYLSYLEEQFISCKKIPAQQRFVIVFPMICSHFLKCTHKLCPEERVNIGSTAVQYAHWFFKETVDFLIVVIMQICAHQARMAEQLLPKHAAEPYLANISSKISKDKKSAHKDASSHVKSRDGGGGGLGSSGGGTGATKPGTESRRKLREIFQESDKNYMGLTELSFALNHSSEIDVWGYKFIPRDIFIFQLEKRLNKTLVAMTQYRPDDMFILRPSELLSSIKALMSVFQSIESYVNVDITRIFNTVFPMQAMERDSEGEFTIASHYKDWYVDVLLRQVQSGSIVFSPSRKAFVSLAAESVLPGSAEEYADICELEALVEIVGPYGVRLISEKIVREIVHIVKELKKKVSDEVALLQTIRSEFNKPERMKTHVSRLTHTDFILSGFTQIGVMLSFQMLLNEALGTILKERIPYLMMAITDFKDHMPQNPNTGLADTFTMYDLASAAGLSVPLDPLLCRELRLQSKEMPMHDPTLISCLLYTYLAVSIPRLAFDEKTQYKAALEANMNNSHCISIAVNTLAPALFVTQMEHANYLEERMHEFVALLSSSLLRLGGGGMMIQEFDKDGSARRLHHSVCILLDRIVKDCPCLTEDQLSHCYPYPLLRSAYRAVYSSDSSVHQRSR